MEIMKHLPDIAALSRVFHCVRVPQSTFSLHERVSIEMLVGIMNVSYSRPLDLRSKVSFA